MATPPSQRQPTFLWQALLILLPVWLMAAFSLVLLHHDEQAAEQDARRRAVQEAHGLAQALGGRVNDELERYLSLQHRWVTGLRSACQPTEQDTFPEAKLTNDIRQWERDYPGLQFTQIVATGAELLSDGRQIEPPTVPSVPQPPKWFCDLTPKQRRLWEDLRQVVASRTNAETIQAASQAFLKTDPSDDARRAVRYLTYPDPASLVLHSPLRTESGISFQDVACYQVLSVTNQPLTLLRLDAVWHRVIENASFVAPALLNLAEHRTNGADAAVREKVRWLRQYWNAETKAREYLGPLRRLSELKDWNLQKPWAHWSGAPDGDALAFFKACTFKNMRNDQGPPLSGRGYLVSFVPMNVLKALFARALVEDKFLIPGYARAVVTVEGLRLLGQNHESSRPGNSFLEGAKHKLGYPPRSNVATFGVDLYLTSRKQMLSAERRRTGLFALLVLTSTFAALVGLLAAYRAFRRQLQLNELKSNFVSSVSHELRAPIASVRLMAENLERGKIPDAPRQSEYFRFIGRECRRLSALIENVLDFSRIEQGRKQYEFEPTDLLALARETVTLMEPYAREKEVQLEWETSNLEHPTPNLELEVDGRAIQQALVNLLDNAIKHSPKGETVKVGIERAESRAGVPPAPRERQPRGIQTPTVMPKSLEAISRGQREQSPSGPSSSRTRPSLAGLKRCTGWDIGWNAAFLQNHDNRQPGF